MGRLSEELCDYRRSNKILSMDWRRGGCYEYEKGGADKVHLSKKSDSELSRLNEVVCVTRPVGGVRSHENCWVGCRSRRCRCVGAGYRGRCPPLFSAAGKAATVPNQTLARAHQRQHSAFLEQSVVLLL